MRAGYKLLLFSVSILLLSSAIAQEVPSSQLQSVVPASPNAAALGKYGELPVGTYTGVPDISIPLYDINTGKLRQPVSLSYHAGGLRVEEFASSVGLGWSLNVPGTIVRQTRGLPDELGYQATHTEVYQFINNQMSAAQRQYFLEQVADGFLDTEPDLFTFNMNGITGSFYFDLNGDIVTIPKTTLKIAPAIGGWSVTDNNGIQYLLAESEVTTAAPATGSIGSPGNPANITTTTSWYVTKIKSLASNDEINFEYEDFTHDFYTIGSQTKYVLNQPGSVCAGKEPSTSYSYNSIQSKWLKKITFEGGSVLFNKSATTRLDVPSGYAVASIDVVNSTGSLFKRYKLDYNYMTSPGAPFTYDPLKNEYYRLILEAVHIEDGAGNDIGGKYTFEYNTTSLPNRLSYDQDFWGYPNNAGNNLKFVPTTTLQTANSGSPVVVAGADRFISPLNAQAGMITKITYPTGGSTVFGFESNRILTTENQQTTRSGGYASVGTHISDGVGVYYSPYFTIEDCTPGSTPIYHAQCELMVNNSNCGSGLANLQCPQISIVGVQANSQLVDVPANFSTLISLAAGVYRLRIDVSFIDPELAASAYASIYFPFCQPIIDNNITYYDVAVGGQRIKSITNFNETGKVSGTKIYDYTDKETGRPTGRAIALPKYISELEEVRQQVQSDQSTTLYNCKFISVSSGSNYPLANTKGSATGYGYVREFTGANGELGMTEFFYTTPETNPDIINPVFPYAPYTSHDWQRGQLLKQIKSKRLNGSGTPAQFRKVEEQVIEYEEKALTGLKGIKTGQRYFPLGSGGTNPPRPIEHVTYDVHTGWYVPTIQTTITYDENDEARKVTSATSIIYNTTNLQQQQSSSTVNNSRQLIKRTRYPVDYTVVANAQYSENLGLKTLLQNNMLTVPVEQYTIRKDANGNEFVVGGTITTFKPDRALPYQIYGLELTAPVPISSFTPSYLDAAGQFVKDSRYKQQVDFTTYDAAGNILQQKKVNDMPMAYVWGYNSTYPIAEAKNAIASQVFYTSFEGGSTGNWTLNGNVLTTGGITGKNSFNGTLTATIPIETDFILTAWTKSNANISVYGGGSGTVLATRGQWKLMQWILNNNGNVQITGGNMDEVRLYPKKALMTTYTYDPVIGVTSQCDASNRISYYEYDLFGRLKLIRDQDGYILKTFDYKYQQQQ